MTPKIEKIDKLLNERKTIDSLIDQLPYKGYPEIKEISGKKYLYIRRKILGRKKSEYIGPYDDSIYDSLVENYKSFKVLSRKKRRIEFELAALGFSIGELSPEVLFNTNFAIANIKNIIYGQAVLEGIATTFPQTEQIINNEPVSNMVPSDIQKILNLKYAWEFILDKDVIVYPSDLSVLKTINKIVEERLIAGNGMIRTMFPVKITGTSYIPPIPTEEVVVETIKSILDSKKTIEEKAVDLCLAVMKGQYFQDGNKRTALIFANHFLISKGKGLLAIPYEKVDLFRRVLVKYYEDEKDIKARKFLLNECIMTMHQLNIPSQEDDREM